MYYAFAFVIFCGACTYLAFRRNPVYALYFYLASIYVHPPSRWWGYMLPDLRWAFLSAAVAVLAVLFHRGKLGAKPLWLANGPAALLLVYTLWMWVQTPWALDPATHIDGSLQYSKYLVAFWFIYRMADTPPRVVDAMLAHSLGCALLGVYAEFTGRSGGRLDGVGGPGMDDANTLGLYLATGVLVCMGLVLSQRGWRRWLCLALLPVIGNGFVLANSRGAFLGLAAGAAVLALCKAREHRRLFWSFALMAALGATLIVDQAFIDRMFTIGDVAEQDNEDADMSARSRLVIVEAQFKMAADYPLGVGFRGTVVLSPSYLDSKWLAKLQDAEQAAGRASHNTFMTALVEQGVFGAMLFIALVIWTLATVPRLRRLSRQGMGAELATLGAALSGALMAVVVAGIATDYLMAEVQFWLYAALVSLLQIGQASVALAVPQRHKVWRLASV